MRIIKFRAWDKVNKKMYPVNWFDKRVVSMAIPKEGNEPWTAIQVFLKDVELMQFIGLKDKNGKEIYEGDRIRVTDKHGNVDQGPVWYFPERASYCIVWHEGESSFTLADIKDTIEIIGNIYENPELLNLLEGGKNEH